MMEGDGGSLSYNSFVNRSVFVAGNLLESIDQDMEEVREILQSRSRVKDTKDEMIELLRDDNAALMVRTVRNYCTVLLYVSGHRIALNGFGLYIDWSSWT